MSTHSAKASDLFRKGYNCAQSVVGSFSDYLSIPFETAIQISSSFGGGIGRLRETCGAALGMLIILGMTDGYTDPDDIELKASYYEKVQCLMKEFKSRLGSYHCRELLGGNFSDSPIPTPRTEEFYLTRPCERIIMTAVEILDDFYDNRFPCRSASDSTKKSLQIPEKW